MKPHHFTPREPPRADIEAISFWRDQAHRCRLRLTEAAHLLRLLLLDPHTFKPAREHEKHRRGGMP